MTTSQEFSGPASEDNDRKRKIVLAGAAGVAVLLAGGYVLLSGGDDAATDVAISVPVKAKVKKAVTSSGKTPAKAVAATVPAATSVRLGRDPFLARYTVPALVPVAPVAPAGGAPAAPGSPTPGGGTTVTSYALKLTKVSGSDNALTGTFSAAGKTQLAKVGSVFGVTQELKLLSLQEDEKGRWTATVQVGDADPFDALVGQTYYVQ